MDSLMNAGKQFLDKQKNHEGGPNAPGQETGDFGVQGGSHLNASALQQAAGGLDLGNAKQQAAADSGEDAGLFDKALSFAGKHFSDGDDSIDEDQVQKAHQQAYNGDASKMDSSSLGSAAALQALKKFTSSNEDSSNNDSGSFQSKLIGMAMSEASKLFSGSGNSGDKQEAVNSAGSTMAKLLLKNKVSGMMGGGSGSGGGSGGGMGQIMSMAQKFM